ncbi:hypothetical protein SNARM312S_02432 [Streptomyces narbonensis]
MIETRRRHATFVAAAGDAATRRAATAAAQYAEEARRLGLSREAAEAAAREALRAAYDS